MAGTRFTKAATAGGAAVNLSNRVLGSNPRKQKLTEGSGTNPSKMGAGGSLMKQKPGPKTTSSGGYAQDTASYKTDNPYDFSVGGPGLPRPIKQ